MGDKEQIGRVAMRVEGSTWVAYYADNDTMVDAVFLGSIKMSLVQREDRKRAFLELIKAAAADALETETGVRPEWGGEQPAPEHERSGSS